jgi:ankyrin repeat protein
LQNINLTSNLPSINRTEILELLIPASADVNAQDIYGRTALPSGYKY